MLFCGKNASPHLAEHVGLGFAGVDNISDSM